MGEPAEHDKPDDAPEHPHGGEPPGHGGTPPGHGGTPPGQADKPDKPEEPDMPPSPGAGEPHPEHPIAQPGEAPHPEPHATATAAPVEALLGLRDFLAVAPRRPSASVTSAAQAALRRWMRLAGHDVDGFYAMPQWQTFYAETMRYTG